MRALITGSRGFVGGWLCHYLSDQGDEVIELREGLNLCDREALEEALGGIEIDVCYHLAALSHVGASWSNPQLYFVNNVVGTANLVAVLARLPQLPRLLHVSSSEVYGRVNGDDLPIEESQPLRPVSPYAASKASAEFASMQAWYGYGLPTVVARPFNHTGPGQSVDYLVPALGARMVEAKARGRSSLRVGNVDARRDFMDVRDVVRAYRLLAVHGVPGDAYNVCSGESVSVREIVGELSVILDHQVDLEVDPVLVRPNDVEVVVGDPLKMTEVTGFHRQFSLHQTIAGVVEAIGGGRSPRPGD
ncbi:GDP-mannose 4,6-dehydratase [Ferrimicrobium sp.]|uniref:GDP-mannose 4,6-dehydratase n=1 Tax=Ferrimicrobium sp. TaxID=2926050 RepID=UPI002635FDE9|nr:GDP-mannose 4,6-dehydratase [Ferrimicrobium sp.]